MANGYPYSPLHNDSLAYPPLSGSISISPFVPSDPQPTLWLTVKGPAPYQKLAIVHEVTQYGSSPWGTPWDGSLLRFSVDYKTSLVYPNYRSDNPPLFRHSTTVSLFQLRTDGTWLWAADQVNTCSFDEGGIWTLNLNMAMQAQGDSPTGWEGMFFRVSSWVLLTESGI